MPDQTSPPSDPKEVVRGFNKILAFRIAEWRDGFARVEVDLQEHHLNRSGLVHGGVLAALIDAACGYTGVYPLVEGQPRRAVTLSMTTTFLGQAGFGTIACTAERRGGGKSIFMASAEVKGPDGQLVAMGECVYRYIPDNPQGAKK
ncbi:MAG TPA: PaaI family thioesterase [Stellaceae bacterium]|nr:PaaI family thioesterase [Stellaceae bacterium]